MILNSWIQESRPAFQKQVSRTVTYLLDSTNRPRLGFAAAHPNGKWLDDVFLPAYLTFSTVFNKWEDPAQRTKNVISDIEDAEKALKPLYKILRGLLTAAPYISNADLLLMDLPERSDSTRHHSPVATVFPIIAVSTKTIGHLDFLFLTLDSENKARKRKPEGQQGAELLLKISATPILKIEELEGGHSYFSTTTNLDVNLEEHRGETVYFAGRWENTRGMKGPWSPIESAIIP